MKKYIKLFEDFDRNENLEGLKLVKKISTDDFMNKLKTNSLDKGNYVYRLINYKPNSIIEWRKSGEMMKPITKGDKKSIEVIDNNMYTSPFIIYPRPFNFNEFYFIKNDDGTYTRYNGKSEKKKKLCEVSKISVLSAFSLSAFVGNRTDGIDLSDTEYMKLVSLIENVFDNEKRHNSWIQSNRNYIGYIFDEVFVYEITDPEAAADTIIDECDATKMQHK